jgi:ppGpp synthetase/RelA/SpoT-type nucleotidyltranferase
MQDLREKHKEIIQVYDENWDRLDHFCKTVVNFFGSRSLGKVVHSVRHRLKDIDHILEKIERKNKADYQKIPEERRGEINKDNFFERVTDLAGVRVLHLHLDQFKTIHDEIMKNVDDEEFVLFEPPKAYTWDPDSKNFLIH